MLLKISPLICVVGSLRYMLTNIFSLYFYIFSVTSLSPFINTIFIELKENTVNQIKYNIAAL
jgi:hypothetical protein